jgi:uncharacterized protein involved in exopolysaccharide biosynthesis
MIVKFLEALFRYKWLVILPPLVIPLVVGPIALLTAPTYYETSAGVWVDRPAYLQATTSDFNPYLTPAQNQMNRLNDLLRTRTFLTDIAKRTDLGPLMGTEAGEQAFQRTFFKGFAVFPSGERVLTLRFRSSSAPLTTQVVNAVTGAFKEQLAADRLSQASLATSFYQQRLQSAQAELDKANAALSRYVAANPRLTTIDPERGAASTTAARIGLPPEAIDPQMGALLNQVQTQQGEVDRANQALQQASQDSQAALQGQEVAFRVVDPPRPPTSPIRERRRALIYPAAGLVAGLGISATVLVLLVASDRAVRSESDLAGLARVVGTVPQLRPAVGKRKRLPEDVRRAIGFAAGAALPMPTGAK